MQRLFSTFANGWPGVGLLLQRCLAAVLLVHVGIAPLTKASGTLIVPQLFAAFAGVLFFLGLWTPLVGTLIAILELWVAVAQPADPWMPIVLATLGGTGAMIGPGAWSVDARLFGRKHIATREAAAPLRRK